MKRLDIVILGLSLSSSWGNGHATTYRALVRALHERGHRVLFLERDVPWYAEHRDLPEPDFCRLALYGSLDELKRVHGAALRSADAVIVGSYVPEGISVGRWAQQAAGGVVAFYDIDTPITLAKLRAGGADAEYISRELIPGYDLYLSFAGGPVLDELESAFGSPCARPLLCSVDAQRYAPAARGDGGRRDGRDQSRRARQGKEWALGYLGTYSDDRQPGLEALLLEVARLMPERRFIVAGPTYPADVRWPANVERIEHLPPVAHREFYLNQHATLNLTRAAMRQTGYAPSVRLFEAAACGTPIISDWWPGLEELFVPGEQILLARRTEDVVAALSRPAGDLERIGRCGRARVLAEHTSERRVRQLERWLAQASDLAAHASAAGSAGPLSALRARETTA